MSSRALTVGGRAAAGEGMRLSWRKAVSWGLAAGLLGLLVGDRAFLAPPPGIDPLEILNLQVKPNVVFVIDTSSTMGRTPETTGPTVGGDDPASRLYQAKVAIRQALLANDGRANFGLAAYHADLSQLELTRNGPLVYVSTDAAAATWAAGGGFFDDIDSSFSQYNDDLISDEVFESLGTEENGFDQPYPPGCTPGTDCRFYIKSRRFRNNVKLFWDDGFSPGRNGMLLPMAPFDCSANPPRAGLLGDDTADANDGTEVRPCFAIERLSSGIPTGEVAVYYYSSGAFGTGSGNELFQSGMVVPVPECSAASNLASMLDEVKLELPLDSTGSPIGLVADPPAANILDDSGNNKPNVAGAGLRLGQGAPIGEVLRKVHQHYDNVVFPSRPAAVDGLQKNFVILITDSNNDPTGIDPVVEATDMFNHPGGNRMETLVVAFTSDPAVPNANAIAQAGSGNTRTSYRAASLVELVNALNAAIGETVGAGTFSTESSITESIFEYVSVAPPGPFSPFNPDTRYSGRVPVLLQTSFDMPGFRGHLKAFINATVNGVGPTLPKWDAGQALLDRVVNGDPVQGLPGMGAGLYTFDQLFGVLHRRIYTSSRNGTFLYDTDVTPSDEQQPVSLWPPSLTTDASGRDPVAPPDDSTAGLFDVAMGLASSDLVAIKNRFGACATSPTTPFPAAHPCLDPARELARSRREAREMILAYTAGAVVKRDSASDLPQRTGTGELQYTARTWILAESTFGVPAVVTPPLEARPIQHTAEYILFRDGPRETDGTAVNGIDDGFGLRNPDKDGQENPPNAAGIQRLDLKPIMSVVYHAANDMIHAFRAGPQQCDNATACPPPNREEGGEELWGYVPFDQMGKLPDRMLAQARDPHTYMNASSIRFTDVFVPADADGFVVENRTFLGKWRTVLFFGRGIAGKHYTALDVTSPGPFNEESLDTNPPLVLWNRGNPDTQDGTGSGAANALTNTVDLGQVDLTAYARMGQTWSVPAVASVPPAPNFDKEFVLFAGSGYSDDPAEGKTFFVIDALTGDVLHAPQVPDSTGSCSPAPCTVPPNVLVASPSAFIAAQLVPNFVGNPSASQATLVYIGDVHGRLWKYITSSPSQGMIKFKDLGVDQPIANPVALLNLANQPQVYVESGNENRVDAPPNFQMWGFKDILGDTSPASNPDPNFGAEKLFRLDFSGPFDAFRGTTQPATAFNAQQNGRVFFVGTKFTPGGVTCRSRFDSVLFAVGAISGNAAYDLNTVGDDRSILLSSGGDASGQKVQAVRGAGGQIVLDKGVLGATPPQAPPAPQAAAGPVGSTGEVFLQKLKVGSAVCR